ncbi:MAG: gamma-glutamyl kinase [Amylibacter sp.]|nr:gamma-glutamyl kinase [Amylibacter sp.]
MLIFLKEQLVFFATPKTASTAIETTLGKFCEIRLSKKPAVKHTSYRKYKRFLAPFLATLMDNSPDRIAAFREPVDWLGSWYRYRGRPELTGSKNSTDGISFDQFVEAYLQNTPPSFARVGSQAKFVSDKDGALGMTHLFRYEKMDIMVDFMEKRLKKQIKLPHSNVSPKAELSLSPALLKELQNSYARDFEIYETIGPDPRLRQQTLQQS